MVKLKKPKAWVFSGDVQDKGHLTPRPLCALCGKPTRYVFNVKSREYKAQVGPDCVLNCSLLREPGETELDARKRVEAQMNQYKKTARQNRLFSIILRLEETVPNFDFGPAKAKIRKDQAISPKLALLLMRMACKHNLNFGKDLIRISLNKQKHRDQYKNMQNHDKIELKQYVHTAQEGILIGLDQTRSAQLTNKL